MQRPGLGVDIGGVIIDSKRKETQKLFASSDYLKTPAVPGALGALNRLASTVFYERLYVVSKCDEARELKTRAWLVKHKFYELTGIPEDRVRFCRERRDKAQICNKLGITHFIDDRLEVLGFLEDVVRHRILFRARNIEVLEHAMTHAKTFSDVLPAYTWQQVEQLVTATR